MAEYRDGEIILNWERAETEIEKEVTSITRKAVPIAKSNVRVRTGGLRRSIRSGKTFRSKHGTGLISGELRAKWLPGGFLEKGTVKMRKKPFLEPALPNPDRIALNIAEAIVRGI